VTAWCERDPERRKGGKGGEREGVGLVEIV